MRKMYNPTIGDPSSEFGYCNGGERFNQKIQQRKERHEELWNDFVAFMREHEVRPDEFRTMFSRYYDEYIQKNEKDG